MAARLEEPKMNVYQGAVDLFGKEAQMIQAAAEMSELSAALSQYLCQAGKKKKRREEIFEEIADAEIMLRQLRVIFGDHSNRINDIKAKKVQKLREILDGKHADYLVQKECKGEHGSGLVLSGNSGRPRRSFPQQISNRRA